MRFLFFAAQYLPTVGGVERYTHSLALELVALGHTATVVTSALPGLPAHETGANGIEVFRLPAVLLMNGRFPVPKHNKAFRALAKQLWAAHYDFAVINTRFYLLSLWAARQCRHRGIAALVLEHGTKHLSLDNPVLNLFGNAYEHFVMKLVRHSCNRLYGVSEACSEWLRHFGVQAQGVLYNAVDAAALAALASPPARRFRAELPGSAATAPLIAFTGRLIVEKGVFELLAAFALVRQTHPSAVLIMAGDGPLMPQLAAIVPAGVVLAGALPYAENIALLAEADIFCLPTYSEGFSTTILEAAALGCCIVTTPTGGSRELIKNGESGILLENIDASTIAGALCRCIEDAAFRQKTGLAVKLAVEQRFTWQKTAETLLRATNAIKEKTGT